MSFVGTKFKKKNNYPDEIAKARLENLVKPIAKLADLPIVDGRGTYMNHFQKAVHMAFRETGKVWKFPYQRKHDHICISVRESFRNKGRDSNRKEWDKFASWAENNGEKVVWVEDAEKNFISVEDRWDKYQCKLNFFVGGGPATLCQLSDAPYATFFKGLTQQDYYLLFVHHWTYTNSQLPWARKNQRIVWSEDTFEKIVRAFERIASGSGSRQT